MRDSPQTFGGGFDLIEQNLCSSKMQFEPPRRRVEYNEERQEKQENELTTEAQRTQRVKFMVSCWLTLL
jgi:hypothetical protein